MNNYLKLNFDNPAAAWLLVQSGFKIRALNWNVFHSPNRISILVYDLVPLSQNNFVPKICQNLQSDDTIWEDRKTKSILIVQGAACDNQTIDVLMTTANEKEPGI